MSAAKILALATLFLATTFAQAEWKEFTFPEGNFRVVFPNNPQRLKGTQRNLHQFSAIAGAESYGVAYADYSPGTDWKSAVNGKRDSIVSRLGASVVDEKSTSLDIGNDSVESRFDHFRTADHSSAISLTFYGLLSAKMSYFPFSLSGH